MKRTLCLLLSGVAGVAACWAQSNPTYRVIADQVNLRARPSSQAEVVTQVGAHDTLTGCGSEGEWIEVAVPTNVDLWVSEALVKNEIVTPRRLKARSGPGSNYHEVGLLNGGDHVVARGATNSWLRIAPPPGATLWVNRAFVEAVLPPASHVAHADSVPPVGQPEFPAVDAALANDLTVGPTSELPPGLSRARLASVAGQGAVVVREGVVQRVHFPWPRPARYRLVQDVLGEAVVASYLVGNDPQLGSFVGRRLVVQGREYRLRNVRFPLLYPETLKPSR
jgi:uncharacterized protein YraI